MNQSIAAMRKLTVYFLCSILLCLPLASCQTPMSPELGSALKMEVNAQERDGMITANKAAAARAAIDVAMSEDGFDWDMALMSLGGIASAVLASMTGVRMQRGAAKPLDKSQADLLKELLAKQGKDA